MSLLIDTSFLWNTTVWNPSMISTALWLDAADASTITTVSGGVSQWSDKSGNTRHATQATTGNRPATGTATLNGRNVIRYDATDDFLSLSNTAGLTSATAFYFFGVRRSSVAAAADTVTARSFLATATGVYFIGADSSVSLSNETTVFLVGPDSSSGGFSTPRSGATSTGYTRSANAAEIYHVFGQNTGTLFGARVNGSAVTSFVQDQAGGNRAPNICNPALTGFNVGGNGGASNGAIVDFAEMLVLTTAPTLDNTQRIEGYLAHKWGLGANLPNDHPYKTIGPKP